MSLTVIKHDESGKILEVRYVADHGYVPDSNEIIVEDQELHNKNILKNKKVDTSTGEVVDDPSWRKKETVKRHKVSAHSKDTFRAARDGGDLQAQLDILFEILTGEEP